MAPGKSEHKSEFRPERLRGLYLFALCVYQIGIYCWPGGPPFILDPRAGIPVLLINRFSFDNKVIYPVEWVTASWLVIAAAMIFFRGRLLKAYLIVEIILAAPTAYYIAILATRLSRAGLGAFRRCGPGRGLVQEGGEVAAGA